MWSGAVIITLNTFSSNLALLLSLKLAFFFSGSTSNGRFFMTKRRGAQEVLTFSFHPSISEYLPVSVNLYGTCLLRESKFVKR